MATVAEIKPVKTTMLIFTPGKDEPETREIELAANPGYIALRDLLAPLLRGGLEHVSVLFNGKSADMFVDEIGLLNNLPRNEAATRIYRAAALAGRASIPAPKDPETLNFIVGPAIVFSRRVWF